MVLSACSKYFEQVFCEYPQQNSTLVILKDYNYNDVQAIIEFMYQGEINVAHVSGCLDWLCDDARCF